MIATAPPTTGILDRVTDYARAVCDGEVVSGNLVRLAAERHLRDIDLGGLRGLAWDEDAAAHAVMFVEQLRHSKGEWAGSRFTLEPWQVFIVGSLFGWYRKADSPEVSARADGNAVSYTDGTSTRVRTSGPAGSYQMTRRFRRLYLEVARKNGKTTLAAAIALYLAFADGEPGAEVYAVATKRDQAKLTWEESRRMVLQTPALKARVQVHQSALARLDTFSKFVPLGRDSDTSSGLNPHGAIIDEIHEHRDRGMIDIIDTAIGARRQPVIVQTTTAGTEDSRVWVDERGYAVQVLEGVSENDALLAFIATIDKGDSWTDESVYVKANPNLGVSVRLEYLLGKRDEAIAQPSRQNAFRRLHLNEPTEQAERWIDMAQWDACDGAPLFAAGDAVFVGMDLSSKIDLSAAVMLRLVDGELHVGCRFYRPEETVYEAEKRDGVPYRLWAEQGHLVLVEGDMVDPAAVAEDVVDWLAGYEVPEVAYDAWNAASAAARLQTAGMTVVALAQGYATFSEPCHTLEALLASRRVRHGGNPVLRWMASQTQVKHGPNNSVRPWKPHGSGLRNDGIVALLMALNRATVWSQQESSGPVFWDFDDA